MEKLWTTGEFPVERTTRSIFFGADRAHFALARPCARSFVIALRLIGQDNRVQFAPLPRSVSFADAVNNAVHRFEESIAGRPYLIEVAAVAKDRWRAYIVRIPGVPTALMPFYGRTPDEAARQLTDWLTNAYARASNPTTPV